MSDKIAQRISEMPSVLAPDTYQVFPVVAAGANKKMSLAQLVAWLPSVLSLAVSRLTQSGAQPGQVLTWTGSQWSPQDAAGGTAGTPSDTLPARASGVGSAGTMTDYSRGDHSHPLAIKRTVPAAETWTVQSDECVVVAGDWSVEGDLLVKDGGVFVAL
jgi:hypothetical protein